ncbi:hypothetical protein VN97_g7887 [Penicillium thymicola]|uniref:Zn(2)-C6 fungal-type domain-containing protein n=1 Tax=Penicillium thymicola TaxID=293382 RepID=A0AAI9TDR7_PENTH|nr:hypothetical protein VN97_g7887 [Penicillium thymicola]
MEHGGSDNERREVPSALVRRACDQCRLRKIRCDKRTPCSNCRSSDIICRSTGEGQKPSEPRRRVLISNQYTKLERVSLRPFASEVNPLAAVIYYTELCKDQGPFVSSQSYSRGARFQRWLRGQLISYCPWGLRERVP